jgi:predicted alpha/beta-fold hydrolase
MRQLFNYLLIKFVTQKNYGLPRLIEFFNYHKYLKGRQLERQIKKHLRIEGFQGQEIICDLYIAKINNPNLIIFLHGYAAKKTEFLNIINEKNLKQIDILVYNMYGDSNTKNIKYTYGHLEKEDLKKIIQANKNYTNIYLVGHSLGALTVLNYLDDISKLGIKHTFIVAPYETFEIAIKNTINFLFKNRFDFITKRLDISNLENFYEHKFKFNPQKFNVKDVINHNSENIDLIFGQNDLRAPYFKTKAKTHLILSSKHEDMFLKYSKAISKITVKEIK